MKSSHKLNLLAVALTGALASVASAAPAADTGAAATNSVNSTAAADPALAPAAVPDADQWKFAVTLPLWAPQVNGNVTVRGRQQDANVTFDQLKDHLDASVSLAAAVSKGKFGIFGDVGYMKFSASGEGPLGAAKASIGLKFLVADAGLSYLLVKTENEHPFSLAGTAGIRYWYTDTRIALSAPGGPAVFDFENTQSIVDPVIGLRASQYLTQKLHLDVGGDYGGFNISHSTDITWSVKGQLAYDFTRWFTLSAGYQAVALDESNGASGTSKKGVNIIFNGILVGLNVHW